MSDLLCKRIGSLRDAAASRELRPLHGRVLSVNGPLVRVAFAAAKLGQICEIRRGRHQESLRCQVIGIEGDEALMSLFAPGAGLQAGLPVYPLARELTVGIGPGLLGRVLDGLGQPLDQAGEIQGPVRQYPIRGGDVLSPMERPRITEPFVTGLKAIDAALLLGRGSRIGVFGPPGTGKSSLMGAISQHCEADVIVIAMIGERGREVRDFLERQLPEAKRKNVVVVAATSDRTPIERLYGAHTATAVAEGFRDEGKSVLLIMDSLTRVARALREIGLAAGEAPTRRGYPASVYPELPKLIERAGRTTRGDITAVYTVLVEGDGEGDPIAEETRSLTDGHINLSQEIADAGLYPAIDVRKSLSRVMNEIAGEPHLNAARELRTLLAKYAEIEILLQVGEYREGSDNCADKAVRQMPAIRKFLEQKTDNPSTLTDTLTGLQEVVGNDVFEDA